MIRAPDLAALNGIQHGFLTRKGGVSAGLFNSLNCGHGSGDSEANVRANRKTAARQVNLGADDLMTLNQVHSANVVEVTEAWDLDMRPKADAMVSRTSGLALGILTADCVPVLLADANAGIIGAAHAGWNGALNGVIGATVRAMVGLGAVHGNITATIGPCIRQDSYEVGSELRETFVALDESNEQHFIPSNRNGHYMFDLAAFVRVSLGDEGVGNISDVQRDTYAEDELFFSYRRATHRCEDDYGRGISLIALEKV